MKLNYFNFKKFGNKILLTNDFGNHIFVSEDELNKIVSGVFSLEEDRIKELINARMIYDDSDLIFTGKNRYDLRNIKNHTEQSTSLHIFVVTTRCNLRCTYCQANNGIDCPSLIMDKEIARKSVDIALQSPTKYLSFEFQGGEPLLNFEIIKFIYSYAEENKGYHIIDYNIVSNLTLLSDDIIEYVKNNRIGISTSLDGYEELHNKNRPYSSGKGSFGDVCSSIEKLRSNGVNVGAIETTTRYSMENPELIIDTYVKLGFDSVFLRPLTPLGKATKNWDVIGYSADEYLEFYKKALDRLIEINKSGKFIKEAHLSILLKRISGQYVNYMELRSPCGASVGQMAYYPDGNVFTCDEGRMFYEMGDDIFCLGNVYENSYKDLVSCGVCKTVCASSILETIPTCCDCVYQPYCGTCPVVNYANFDDLIEKNPRGYRCSIYMGMLDIIFSKYLEKDAIILDIFKKWSN